MPTLGRMGLRLGIDMDGVVADFNGGWMDAFNAERGTSLHPDLVDGWDVLPTLTGFTDMSAFWDWARDLGAGHSVFRHLSPFPGAIQTLQRLVATGHDVVIITAKPDWSIPDTLSWLGDHRIQAHEVHFAFDKWKIDCDVYVDDAPHVLEDLVRHRPSRRILRFVRSWNRPLEGTTSVRSWDDVEQAVSKFAQIPLPATLRDRHAGLRRS